MSGHSKWANIRRTKGKTDAARGQTFTKIGREIAVAVKAGGPDPNTNSKLKDVISKAKKINYIYLDKVKEETNRSIIFDAVKVKLLQDETEIYFIEEGMYANYVANCVFGLNKIAIIY